MLPECAKMCRGAPGCAGIRQGAPGCARVCMGVLGCIYKVGVVGCGFQTHLKTTPHHTCLINASRHILLYPDALWHTLAHPETYLHMHMLSLVMGSSLGMPVCTCVHQSVPKCARARQGAPGCAGMRQSVYGCVMMHL